MKENQTARTGSEKKELLKTAILALGMVGISALAFNGLTEAAAAAELSKTETVATSYDITQTAEKKAVIPKGYQKADYKVVSDPLEYYQDKKPPAKALTKEKAAELGAQMIWEVYGVDLEGATIYMGYDPGGETFPRAFWSGDIRFGSTRKPGQLSYGFMLDAVTGERFQAAMGRTIDAQVSLELDRALEKNPQEYLDLAKKLGAKYKLVSSGVASAQYNCQGYAGNDPSISIDVIGKRGEKALITFSRYDQAIQGMGWDTSTAISEAAHEKLIEELEAKMNQARNQGDANASQQLIGIE